MASAGNGRAQGIATTFELDFSSISINVSLFYYSMQLQASQESTSHSFIPKEEDQSHHIPELIKRHLCSSLPHAQVPWPRRWGICLQEMLYPNIWYPGRSEVALGSLECESPFWCSGRRFPFCFVTSENLHQKKQVSCPPFLYSPGMGMKPGGMELQPPHLLIQLHSSCCISSCILPLAGRGSQPMTGTCHRCSLELI